MSYENDILQLEANPFKIFYPNSISNKMFRLLFSEDYTWLNKLREREDIFINGSRGCGKTTLIYYFKLDILRGKHGSDFLNPEINKNERIIGIYLDGKSDFEQGNSNFEIFDEDTELLKKYKVNLCVQDVFFTLISRTLSELRDNINEIIKKQDFNNNLKEEFNFFFQSYLKMDLEISPETEFDLIACINLINQRLISILQDNIEEYEKLSYKNKIEEKPRSYRSIDIQKFRDFILLIKKAVPPLQNFSFYILLDDGDRLNHNYQNIFNLLIKPRKHNDFCLKIVLEKGWEQWNFSYSQKDHIQFPHDYDMIDLNELYSNNLEIYSRQVMKICEKRFNLLKRNMKFEEFFLYSKDQIEFYNKSKVEYFNEELLKKYQLHTEEFDSLPLKRQKEIKREINNIVNKYLQVRLFRSYKSKGRIPYSGYKNVIYVSSGIIRDFLEIASKMYESVKRKNNLEIVDQIPPSIQTDLIYSNSEGFLKRLDKHIEDKKDLALREAYQKLSNFIYNLGYFFKQRFYNEDLKDVRLFSFIIKDDYSLSEEIKNILNIGLRENYLHEYFSTTKDGFRRTRGYSLHRLLLPFFQLDPTSLRGRVEFSTKIIKSFVKERGFVEKGEFKSQFRDISEFFEKNNTFE